MSRPPLELTPFGTKTTNRTTSPIDSIPVGTKTLEPTPRTRPTDLATLTTDLPEQNGKAYVPREPDPDPSLSDSSSNKYYFSNDSNSIKSIKKKRDKKKTRWKHKKQDASDSLLSDYDMSDNNDYRHRC